MANIIGRQKPILPCKICAVLIVYLIISLVPFTLRARDSVYTIEIAKFSHPEIEEFVRDAVVPFARSANFEKDKGIISIKKHWNSVDMIEISINFCPTDISSYNGYICDSNGMPIFIDEMLVGNLVRTIGKITQLNHYQPDIVELLSVCDDQVVWIFELEEDAIFLTEVIDYGMRLKSDYAQKNLIPLQNKLYNNQI